MLLIITNRFGAYDPKSLAHYAKSLGYSQFIEIPSDYTGALPDFSDYVCYDLFPTDLRNTRLAKTIYNRPRPDNILTTLR